MDCLHQNITTFIFEDTMQPAMWACKDCGHKFVPIDIPMEKDAARYRWLRGRDFCIDASITSANANAAIDAAMK